MKLRQCADCRKQFSAEQTFLRQRGRAEMRRGTTVASTEMMRPEMTQACFEGDLQGKGYKVAVNEQRHGEK